MAKLAKTVCHAAAALLTTVAMAARTEPTTWPLPSATPAAVGMSAPRLKHMGEYFRGEVARNSAAGYVIMVARHGKLIYSSAVGMRDRENAVPMTLDTRFRIFSMTKPVTSAAVLMLYEEGRFHLDDPVSTFLPEFAEARVFSGTDAAGNITTEALKRPISIRHLLTHTSGLGYGPGYDSTSPLAKVWASAGFGTPGTLAEKVRALAKVPLYSQPGDQWRYSFADDVLGRFIEVVSGMPFEQLLNTRIFDPLGMRNTAFFIPPADVTLLASAYRRTKEGGLERTDGGPSKAQTTPPPFPSGGGGLISTASDYLRFAQMLANGGSFEGRQYLSPVTIELMTSNQVPVDAMFKYWGDNSRGLGYGMGVAPEIDASIAPQANLNGDYSWGGALDTHWIVSPRSGIVAIIMAQVNSGTALTPVRTDADFRNLLFAAVTTLEPGR